MNDSQLNYRTMTGVTSGFLNTSEAKAVWGGNTKATKKFAEVTGTVSKIDALAVLQATSASGSTNKKLDKWEEAANQSEHVCNGVLAYASDIKDTILWGQVNFTITDFKRGDVDECITIMQLVHDKAAALDIASLKEFNVVAADITTLKTNINDLRLAAPGYRILQSSKKTVTGQLKLEFITLRKQMKELDEIIVTFNKANPNFVSSYKTARKIINLGS